MDQENGRGVVVAAQQSSGKEEEHWAGHVGFEEEEMFVSFRQVNLFWSLGSAIVV